jgi:hypothetical protein
MHQDPRYLLPESIRFLVRCAIRHPAYAIPLYLSVFAAFVQILRWRFRRTDSDILLFAGVLTVILLVVASALYVLTHVKGFHFGG